MRYEVVYALILLHFYSSFQGLLKISKFGHVTDGVIIGSHDQILAEKISVKYVSLYFSKCHRRCQKLKTS